MSAVNEETMGLLLSSSDGNAGIIGALGALKCVNVGTMEVLGSVREVKEGIIGETVESCVAYTAGLDIVVVICVSKDDIGKSLLLSKAYAGGMGAFVVFCGVNVGTTCVSVAFRGVKVETSG